MVKKAIKGVLYLALGVLLVYFIKDPIISLLVGLVVVAVSEVIGQKFWRK